ncbi:MAG: Holliday junction resolvase RuvX [Myxococcales bacterium]|nr:Holliday junction resolvase RuvX [Myxococcales bacterium]
MADKQDAPVGRVAALDWGKARVGLAVSDELGLYAHARPALDGRDRRALLSALATLAREEPIRRFLVGLPLDMSGRDGPAADRATRFAAAVCQATGVEVELVDERLTTVQAERSLAEQGASTSERIARRDGAAAAILLQSWLDGRRARRRSPRA